MARVRDIITIDNDISIVNGDFLVNESDYNHIQDILRSLPGHYKENPLLGANILALQNGRLDKLNKAVISANLSEDGYVVEKIAIENEVIVINANRR